VDTDLNNTIFKPGTFPLYINAVMSKLKGADCTDFPDPRKLLIGNGTQYRYFRVRTKDDFPAEYVEQLLAMAYENAVGRQKPVKKIIKGETIVKSISPVRKRPGGIFRD